MRRATLLALTLTACAPGSDNGTWTGDVTPTTANPACEKTRGIAQVNGDTVTFSPNQGTWRLLGNATADGQLTAERITTGANKQPFETRLEARRTPTTITGTYTTPRCTYRVTLTR